MKEFNIERVKKAYERIHQYIRKTPLIHSEVFSELCSGNVYLKLENLQVTNSFKIRGALNRMSLLSKEEKALGIMTASSGNHAQGVALAAKFLNTTAKIFVPLDISKMKLNRIQQYNVTVIQEGNFDEIEAKAMDLSQKENIPYLSPYNDLEVIAGQGTIGLEIYEQIEKVDSIVVPVGGGGLISGIALVAKTLYPGVEIIGVQTKGASTMYESWKAGKIVKVEEFPTIAEGLLGGLDANAMTFQLIQKYVDSIVLVQEENVKKAIKILWENEGQIVEGAGATAVAYLLEEEKKFARKNVVAVISGGNIDDSLLNKILREQ
ncbi:MAG: threonine/serine dehydratase [Candidatus Thorarchaeota archaeon]